MRDNVLPAVVGRDPPSAGERLMDRIDAMKVFVAALDEGSLAGVGRKLGRSPAAVSRAIAFLEAHVGAELLHRTTRSIKLSFVAFRSSGLRSTCNKKPRLVSGASCF